MDFVVKTPPIRVTAITIGLLLLWRFWRFTVRPRLHPDEPKELPYWIPYIGHLYGFFMDFNGVIEKGRNHFAPSRQPFTIVVAGQTIYVATAPEDINYAWKNSKTISLDPIALEMYVLGGLSERSRKAMFEPHPKARYNIGQRRPLTPTQMTIELHQHQLGTGERADKFVKERMLPSIFKKLNLKDQADTFILSHPSKDSAVVSLRDLCLDIFITEPTEAYFGPALLKQSPNLVKAFMQWEFCSWKFFYKIPPVFSQDMAEAKNYLTGAFADYYRQPQSQRVGANYYIEKLEELLVEIELTKDEMALVTLLHYMALGNLYKLAFWVVSYLVHNATLLQEIREEVLPAVRQEQNQVDEVYLQEQCPKLNALVNETLRLTVTSSLPRTIVEPTEVGGKMLKPGNKVMLPMRELHYDTEVWGDRPDLLKMDRFIDSKLSKSLSFRPWGGGHTLCPGRIFSRRSVNAFVSILLAKHKITVESSRFPKGDETRPSPGIVTLGRGEDLKLRLVPRGPA